MATLSPEEERRLKSEYGDIFGGLLSSSVTPVASSEFTKIAHEPRYADTLSPEDLAEITKSIDPDSKWDRWATEGVPFYPGTTTRDYDPRTDTTIIDPPTLTIPEVDTFKELSIPAARKAVPAESEIDWDAYSKSMEARYLSGELGIVPLGGGSTHEGGYVWEGMPGTGTKANAISLAEAGSLPTLDERLDVPAPKEDFSLTFPDLSLTLPDIPELYNPYKRGPWGDIGDWIDAGRDPAPYWESIDDYTKSVMLSTTDLPRASESGRRYPTITEAEKEKRYGLNRMSTYDAMGHPDFDKEGYLKIEARIAAAKKAKRDAEDAIYFASLDERLDIPDVRTYTPAAGEVVSPSFLDSIISPAAAGSMTPGRGSAADEYTALEMLRKEEADKAVLREYAARYGASPDKDFADYSKITTGRLFEDLGISPDLDTRGLEMYPETYTYPKASEAELMRRDADIRYGDWESIRPDTDPYFKLADTKEADYVLGGDPYYGRRPALLGRTPPAPEEPGFFDTVLGKASDFVSPFIDTAKVYAEDVYDVRSKEIRDLGETISDIPGDIGGLLDFFYTKPMETAVGPPTGYRDASGGLREFLDPDPYRRKAPDPFPLRSHISGAYTIPSDPTWAESGPLGYSSITGTFYPTLSEIMAAEAAASEPLT